MKLAILFVVSCASIAHGLADVSSQQAPPQQLQPLQQAPQVSQFQQPNQQPQENQQANPLGDLFNMMTGGSNKEGPDFMKMMGDFASMMGNSANTNTASGSNKEGPDFMKMMGNFASMMGNSANTNTAAGSNNAGPNMMNILGNLMNGADGKNGGQAIGDLIKTMLKSGHEGSNKDDEAIDLMVNVVDTLLNSKNEKGEFDINKMVSSAMSTGAVKNLMNLIMKEVHEPQQLPPPKVALPEPRPEPFNWLLYVVLPILVVVIAVLLWFVIFGTPVQLRRSFKPKYSMV